MIAAASTTVQTYHRNLFINYRVLLKVLGDLQEDINPLGVDLSLHWLLACCWSNDCHISSNPPIRVRADVNGHRTCYNSKYFPAAEKQEGKIHVLVLSFCASIW
jgi:hypothetical protein